MDHAVAAIPSLTPSLQRGPRFRARCAVLLPACLACMLGLGRVQAADAQAPQATPEAGSSTSAAVPGVDAATVRAANVAADAYLASEHHDGPASAEAEHALAAAESELLVIRGLLAEQHTDAAGTHYLTASKFLAAINAGDRQALGARLRRAQDELTSIAQTLVGSSAVDPGSHPAVSAPPPPSAPGAGIDAK